MPMLEMARDIYTLVEVRDEPHLFMKSLCDFLEVLHGLAVGEWLDSSLGHGLTVRFKVRIALKAMKDDDHSLRSGMLERHAEKM